MTTGTDTLQNCKSKASKVTRPKPCYLWSTADVQKWLKRHCFEYYSTYSHVFMAQEVNGKVLVGLSQGSLARLGVVNPKHHDDIWRQILKLRLKLDIQEMKEIQMRAR